MACGYVPPSAVLSWGLGPARTLPLGMHVGVGRGPACERWRRGVARRSPRVAIALICVVARVPAWVSGGGSLALRSTSGLAEVLAAGPRAASPEVLGQRTSLRSPSPLRIAAGPRGVLHDLPLKTSVGRRMADALQEDPESFQHLLEEEVQSLRALSALSELERTQAATWRQRVESVLRGEKANAASELLHLKVFHRFAKLGFRPLERLVGRQGSSSERVDPKTLVRGLYSREALGLVAEHVRSIIGEWDHLVRDFPLQVSTFQVGQVYVISALFGYYLRRADSRFQLDKLAGSVKEEPNALARYAADFGIDQAWCSAAIASREAEETLEAQVAMLFGDFTQLQKEAGLRSRLEDAVATGQVASLRVTIDGLRRLALEGCAFGHLLGEAEADLGSSVHLTPASKSSPVALLGGEAMNVPKFAKSRASEM